MSLLPSVTVSNDWQRVLTNTSYQSPAAKAELETKPRSVLESRQCKVDRLIVVCNISVSEASRAKVKRKVTTYSVILSSRSRDAQMKDKQARQLWQP